MKRIIIIIVTSLFIVSSIAQTGAKLYVSANTGSNRNDGSITSPFKDIEKAVEAATDGATIHVAQGVYMGLLNKGFVEIKKYVSLIGGYSEDFSQRDPVRNATYIQPDHTSNGTSMSTSLFNYFAKGKPGTKILIDGFVFDKGRSNVYMIKEDDRGARPHAWPKGVQTSRIILPPEMGVPGDELVKFANADKLTDRATMTRARLSLSQLIFGDIEGDLTIQNCVFANAPYYAIQMGNQGGNWVIRNNVFVNCRMAACEIPGKSTSPDKCSLTFENNTVLFVWTRDHLDTDMGYGFRYMTGINTITVKNNIFGCCEFAGIDRTRIDSDKAKDVQRKSIAVGNLFFGNREADISLPGSGRLLRVRVKDFEDVDLLTTVSGNKALEDLSVLDKAVNLPYLNGFLTMFVGEDAKYDPNSGTNQFRAAVGANQQGTIVSKRTMWCNRYPTNEAFKLFGALSGVGAQSIK